MKLVSLIKIFKQNVHTCKHFSDNFSIQNGLKQDVLLPLHFIFALECALRKVQKNKVELKLNGIHQFLAYADDVN
jgi:hypothetical protein